MINKLEAKYENLLTLKQQLKAKISVLNEQLKGVSKKADNILIEIDRLKINEARSAELEDFSSSLSNVDPKLRAEVQELLENRTKN
jgi:cell division septum initiation protein DivIVA